MSNNSMDGSYEACTDDPRPEPMLSDEEYSRLSRALLDLHDGDRAAMAEHIRAVGREEAMSHADPRPIIDVPLAREYGGVLYSTIEQANKVREAMTAAGMDGLAVMCPAAQRLLRRLGLA